MDPPIQPYYEIHQNDTITTYSYFPQDDEYLMSKITKDEFSDPEIFEIQYIGEGERRPGLLLGMIDYEIIEENDDQVVIEATIDPEVLYGASAEYMYIKSWTKTIYFAKSIQQVDKVEVRQIIDAAYLMPDLKIDGKLVEENEITYITLYMNINSSYDFALPE